MSIGRGWYPEEPEDERSQLAVGLLKGKLTEIFAISAARYKARMEGKDNVFNNEQGKENG